MYANTAARAAEIEFWYGPNQQFGILGSPQKWINVLGNASDIDGMQSLTFTLNGGNQRPLSMGPDSRRLVEEGDFNIEIDRATLLHGNNTIVVTATDLLNNITLASTTISYDMTTLWPTDYWTDWISAQSMSDAAQVVDGKWTLASSGVRTEQVGYDRTFAIGDENTWTSYEVTVPITIHGFDLGGFNPISVAPGIGFTNRWKGHTTFSQGEQPHAYWLPAGVTPWYDYYNERLQLSMQNTVVYDTSGLQLNIGETYIWKLRTEALSNGDTFHGFKVWSEASAEPPQWLLSGIKNPPAVNNTGSLIIIPHHVDATFGEINVIDLDSDTDPPIISGIQTLPQPSGATIRWSTSEPATTSLEYGLDQTYTFGEITKPGYVINHSIFLPNLTPDTDYHFRINTADARQNSTVSADQQFTFVPTPISTIVSDDFSNPTLDSGIWTFVDAIGDVSLGLTGTQLVMHLPAGVDRDFWSTSPSNKMPRLLQSVADEDFEVEAKFESPMNVNYQIQGITVEQDSQNILRMEFLYIGSSLNFFAASVSAQLGTATVYANFNAGVTAPMYMRVNRTGDLWVVSISDDGIDWTAATSFTKAIAVTAVGLYAANSSNTAHTATIDYFFNTLAPIVPEDGESGGDLQPPSAPQFLSGTALSDTAVQLTWTASTDNVGVAGYDISRNDLLLATVTTPGYTDNGLIAATDYNYAVVAFDAAGNRSAATLISATTDPAPDIQAPTPPTSLLSAALSETSIQLSWTASTDNIGVSGYEISRDGAVILTVSSTDYTDDSVHAGATYAYSVVALDAAGNRSGAATSSATTPSVSDTEAPVMPANLTAVAWGDTAAQLSWAASEDNVGVVGYQLSRDGVPIATTTSTGYTDQGLSGSTSYNYAVIALDAASNQSAAATASVTTASGSTALGCNDAASTHLWGPQPTRAPLLLVFSHPDDEVIQFRGVLPYYRNVRNIPIVGISTTNYVGNTSDIVREAELRNAFWTYGMRNPPLYGNQPDNCFGADAQCVLNSWNYNGLVKYLTEQIRRYQPEVVLTHDLNGEVAGHPNHIVTALATIDAYNYASDPLRYPEQLSLPGVNVWQPRKLYLHQYQPNSWLHDWETQYPELGGKTAQEVAEAGFLCHVSQYTPPRTQTFEEGTGYRFGLYQTDIGVDTIGGDLFENVVITPVIERTLTADSTLTQVKMTALTPGSSIRYTTDGTNPGISSAVYSVPLLVDRVVEVKARAFISDTQFSEVRIAKATAAPVTSSIVSSDFSGSVLDTDIWTFVDPIGDVTLNMTGTQAEIIVPAGFNRDYWVTSPSNNMPRLLQSIVDEDFEVETKFESAMNTNYQIQGITVEENSLNIMRMEFMYINSNLVFFAAAIIDGNATVHANQQVNVSAPMYMRVNRSGNQWTVSVSNDGLSWTVAKTFNQSMTVNSIGVYAANSTNTAHTASIDYFFNTASPIVPEDGDTEAPTPPTNLLGAALNDTSIALNWTDAIDNVAVTGYEISRDGVVLATVTTAAYTDTSLIAATAYDYAVVALDAAGNRSTAATVSVTTDPAPDTEAPTPPTNLQGSTLDDTSIALTWTDATDNVAVTGYEISRDGALLTTVTSASYTDTALLAETAYEYAVVALDAAGNRSTAATVSVTTNPAPDTEAPTPVTNLLGAALNHTSIALNWTAATDNVAVAGYEISRDGVVLTTVTTPTYTDTGLTAVTAYDYTVVALDAAGNRSTAATVSVTTDPAPDTEAPTPPTNLLGSALDDTSIALNWTAANDNVAVATYEISRDGVVLTNVTTSAYTDSGLTAETAYDYAVVALDTAGNRSVAATVSVTTDPAPDTEAPSPVTNLLGAALDDTSIALTWTAATDNVAVTGYEVSRDGVVLTTVTTPSHTDSGLTAATGYDYTVVALDAVGNRSAPATVSGTTDPAPDTEAPSIPTNVVGVAESPNVIQLIWTASTDNVEVTGYEIKRGAQVIATVTSPAFSESDLSPKKSYSYSIVALDAAGNRSSAATISVTTPQAEDNQVPSTPANLVGVAVSASVIELNWTASTDNVAVTGYEIRRGGVLIATVTSTTFTDTGLGANKQYNYRVVARDAAINRSAAALVSVTTPLPPGC